MKPGPLSVAMKSGSVSTKGISGERSHDSALAEDPLQRAGLIELLEAAREVGRSAGQAAGNAGADLYTSAPKPDPFELVANLQGTLPQRELPSLSSSPVDQATREQLRSLPRHRLNFEGWVELPPFASAPKGVGSNPTPLCERFIEGPWSSVDWRVLLLQLYGSREDAIRAAAKRVPSGARMRVRRYIVQIKGIDVDVVDARSLSQLTDRAVLDRLEEAWRSLEAIRLQGAGFVIIRSTVSGADEVAIFPNAFDQVLVANYADIYEVDRNGHVKRRKPE
jgi:hypothetical protein